ncbi:9585_t:CDS:2 [Funneliformis mosseae]|uniref:9585_t:CDS:1 n=1 Tax=Funneliformis mosseae TaxID=27381 RepID=A0A9N9D2M3_FUNMO|nr:9585_t:CDS:2 [Funneliformis mosseae]
MVYMSLSLIKNISIEIKNFMAFVASSINDNRTFADLLKEVLNSTDLSDINITVDF